MRVSTNMMYQRGVRSLQNANERLDTANQQLTTGNKFSSAGEDPVGMSQAQSLSIKIALYNQYNNNGGLLNKQSISGRDIIELSQYQPFPCLYADATGK